jgi:hypothetical protein
MLAIDNLIEKLIDGITNQSKNHLPLIINENARVENYFSIIILSLLDKFKSNNSIDEFKFQHLVNENKRKHIDFYINQFEKNVLIELKHLAIDNHNKQNNRRNLNFYTSFTDSGMKVGIIGDLEKLEKLENNKSTIKISFAIVTNPPSNEEIEKRLNILKQKKHKWNFYYKVIRENNIGFIISKMI